MEVLPGYRIVLVCRRSRQRRRRTAAPARWASGRGFGPVRTPAGVRGWAIIMVSRRCC